MTVLVPGATTEGQKAAIAKLTQKLQEQLNAIDAKFAGRKFVAADVLDEIGRVADICKQWYVIQYGGTYDRVARYFFAYDNDKLKGLGDLIGQVGDIQDTLTAVAMNAPDAEYTPDYVFDSTDKEWQDLYHAERAPIEWLMGTAPPTLANFSEWDAALTEAADDVKNIPSITLKWLLEQLFKSFNLPTWFIPVVGVTALVGVGAWAYFSFLAPVGASARLMRLRHNPRRRRRFMRRRRS